MQIPCVSSLTPGPQCEYPGSIREILKISVSFLPIGYQTIETRKWRFPHQESHAWPRKRQKPASSQRSTCTPGRFHTVDSGWSVRPPCRRDLSPHSDHGSDLTGLAHYPASFALCNHKPQFETPPMGLEGIPELLCSSPQCGRIEQIFLPALHPWFWRWCKLAC